MAERTRKSAIINIGSEAGDYYHKYFSIYCGTKAYVNHFTRCLQYEFGGDKFDILLFEPGPTNTPLL